MPRWLRTLLLCLLLVLAGPALHAQTWPAKPIRIIVPFAPGGPADLLPRLIGPKLSEAWGQPIVVENKPGAGGNIGMDLVAKASPDGYTLVIGPNGNLVVNPHLYANLPYDPGFEAVSWYALLAPAGTPKEIVIKLQTEIARILQLPDVKEKLSGLGGEPVGNSPEQLAAMLRTESARYADIVKRANIKAE